MVYTADLKSAAARIEGSSPSSRTIYRRNCMSKQEDVLKRAYGNVPREVGFAGTWDFIPTWRGFKYYWLKLVRKVTR